MNNKVYIYGSYPEYRTGVTINPRYISVFSSYKKWEEWYTSDGTIIPPEFKESAIEIKDGIKYIADERIILCVRYIDKKFDQKFKNLPLIKKQYIEINTKDLNKFIHAAYNNIPKFNVYDCINSDPDNIYTKYKVEKIKLNTSQAEVFNEFIESKGDYVDYNVLPILLQDMCNKGLIESGDYLIESIF